jgi:peptidoglycan/xylan/chitin deacetylase (PgdA/CDA1 family)
MSQLRWYPPILAYHRVGEATGDHVPTVSAESFERQLRWLRRSRCRFLSLDDLAGALERGARLPRRGVAITFDDGYEETCRIAWPLLKRYGACATVFIAPGEVGLKGFATWEQLASMAADGMAIGSHTMHHAYLPLAAQESLAEELVGSKEEIERRIGRPVLYLSYPIGGFTRRVMDLARQAGYRAACTTNRALPGCGLERFALRRIKMTERDANPVRLLAKVCGFYDFFRQLDPPA